MKCLLSKSSCATAKQRGGYYYNLNLFKNRDKYVCRPKAVTFSCVSVCFHPVTLIVSMFGKLHNWNLNRTLQHLCSKVISFTIQIQKNVNYHHLFNEACNTNLDFDFTSFGTIIHTKLELENIPLIV